jgi:hypothetical protein
MRTSRFLLLVCVVSLLFAAGCVRQTVKVEQARALTVQALSAKVTPSDCPAGIDGLKSKGLAQVTLPPSQECKPHSRNGYPIPDPKCTPGAVNPTLTLVVLTASNFTTGCVRNHATSATQKGETYDWYGLAKPDHNTGTTQTCELDHVIPLVIGGADTLDNIWPQCGPDEVTLNDRYFKEKDCVETYLAVQVRTGEMSLSEAQHGIAKDWTQYRTTAKKAKCHGLSQEDSVD